MFAPLSVAKMFERSFQPYPRSLILDVLTGTDTSYTVSCVKKVMHMEIYMVLIILQMTD